MAKRSNENRLDKIINAVQKNEYLIDETSEKDNLKINYGYNNHVVISANTKFLEALKDELGGEILENKNIGSFLYIDVDN